MIPVVGLTEVFGSGLAQRVQAYPDAPLRGGGEVCLVTKVPPPCINNSGRNVGRPVVCGRGGPPNRPSLCLCPYLVSSETTAKGTGLEELAAFTAASNDENAFHESVSSDWGKGKCYMWLNQN